MIKALIVIDMQNDFTFGSLKNEAACAIIEKVRAKIRQRAFEGAKIIFTQDTHQENYLETNEGKHLPITHCVAGTKGWFITSDLDTEVPECKPVFKKTFGYLGWKEFFEENGLLDADEVEIIGVCTDICVVTNALILKTTFPETEFYVDPSCCAGTTIEAHNAAITTMKSCQINIE